MKSTQNRNLLIHSILIFVLSFVLNTFIHEGAHAVMAKATGLHPVLHHNYVSSPGEEASTLLAKILIPAAGPLMSLFQGIIFLILLRSSSKKSLATLWYLWMSVMGFINIGGYLMLTPLVPYGDTGKVFSLLHAPPVLKWGVAVGAFAGLIRVILNFTSDFERQLPTGSGQPYMPGKFANILIALPVSIGCIITSLLSLPVPTPISIIYPATSPFITFMIYGRLRGKGSELSGNAVYPANISVPLIIVTIVVIVISRVLVSGFAL